MTFLLQESHAHLPPKAVMNPINHPLDVVIVGAGPAGLGVAVALLDAGIENILVLERDQVGSSFAQWPKETRFITPSFPSNSIGMLDLNSIAIGISPAYNMRVEHPTGQQYADHLKDIASHFKIPIREEILVTNILQESGLLRIETMQGIVYAKHVVWAVGEFQYPKFFSFIGSTLCRHTATIDSYDNLEGEEFIIVGGYESGVDAAYHLACRNKRVTLIDSGCPWRNDSSDPSITLSTFSFERMNNPLFKANVKLVQETPIVQVEEVTDGFQLRTKEGQYLYTATQPLLATGFRGGHGLIGNLFKQRDDGFPLLTKNDESTEVPGVFLCGPYVRQGDLIFCFIFKYRQRFAVVAKAIATSLGLPAAGLEEYRKWGMYLDDLTVCGQDCVC